MINNNSRLQYLLNQYTNGSSSEIEETELFGLLRNTKPEAVESLLAAILEQTAPMPDANRRQRTHIIYRV